MALAKFTKDPDAVLDYTIDWSQWLPTADTISAVTTTPAADPDPGSTADVNVDSVSNTDTTTTVWLSGGTAGSSYDVVVHITTDGGRQDDRTITIAIKEQ